MNVDLSKPEVQTLSLAEACLVLGISYDTGKDLARFGRFPVRLVKVGRQWRCPKIAMAKWLEGDE